MSRLAKRITKEELKQAIESNFDDYGFYDVIYERQVTDDLSKINFDFENASPNAFTREDESLLIKELPNGMFYCLCSAGGDWEYPVHFILYMSDKNKIRGYVPSKGNTYNTKFKCAYGSEEDNENYDEEVDCFDIDETEPTLNLEEFEEDIMRRIKLS